MPLWHTPFLNLFIQLMRGLIIGLDKKVQDVDEIQARYEGIKSFPVSNLIMNPLMTYMYCLCYFVCLSALQVRL